MNEIQGIITERISQLTVDCPVCEDMYSDDQYSCSTCGCQGGQGTIYVVDYYKERKVADEHVSKSKFLAPNGDWRITQYQSKRTNIKLQVLNHITEGFTTYRMVDGDVSIEITEEAYKITFKLL